MGYEIQGEIGSFDAAADLSSYQYRGVTLTSTGVNLPSAGAQIIGILLNKPTALGRTASVRLIGPVERAILGGTITVGTSLKIAATGKFVAAAATDKAVALCLEAGADGEERTVMLLPHVAV
jgi:hypothetical protein